MSESGATKGLKRSASSREGSISPPPVKRAVKSTTTKTAVSSFFTPTSKKEPEKTTWRTVDNSLLVAKYAASKTGASSGPSQKRVKIASFDFDSTLIRTASGNQHPKHETDWKWWHANVPGNLKRLYEEGHQIVILSNQGGISLKSDPKTLKGELKRLAGFKSKVSTILAQLDLPISLYAATADDIYRKPRTGMWREMLEDYDLDVNEMVDLQGSFLVGDAAGRANTAAGTKDFACSDRNFAANVGIAFHTPEEYFLHETTQEFSRQFDPVEYLANTSEAPIDSLPFPKTSKPHLVLLCGSPGSGKSTFYWNRLKPLDYERVNQDILKSRDKCMKVAETFLMEGTSVAIDNTNADTEVRAKWIELSRKNKVPIHCVYLTASARLCEHNDAVRALNGELPPDLTNMSLSTDEPRKACDASESSFPRICIQIQRAQAGGRVRKHYENGISGMRLTQQTPSERPPGTSIGTL
ncbi:MAG: hypothetical protein M1837_000845 [Sclerophora amabilis]|nr:MAG: hypothetical protein M1837_000845 [Sclerophora amabilis]